MFTAPGHPLNKDTIFSSLAVDQSWQAAGAYPQALPMSAARQQRHLLLGPSTLKTGLNHVGGTLLLLSVLHHLLVERHSFPFLHTEGSGGAYAQAETCAIAQLLLQYSGLAIHQLYGSLCAGDHAQATAVAQLFVNLDNGPSDHRSLHRYLLRSIAAWKSQRMGLQRSAVGLRQAHAALVTVPFSRVGQHHLEGPGDSSFRAEILAVTTISTILRVDHLRAPFLQGQRVHGTGLHTLATSRAKRYVDLRRDHLATILQASERKSGLPLIYLHSTREGAACM
jgi:hypothetical protein